MYVFVHWYLNLQTQPLLLGTITNLRRIYIFIVQLLVSLTGGLAVQSWKDSLPCTMRFHWSTAIHYYNLCCILDNLSNGWEAIKLQEIRLLFSHENSTCSFFSPHGVCHNQHRERKPSPFSLFSLRKYERICLDWYLDEYKNSL